MRSHVPKPGNARRLHCVEVGVRLTGLDFGHARVSYSPALGSPQKGRFVGREHYDGLGVSRFARCVRNSGSRIPATIVTGLSRSRCLLSSTMGFPSHRSMAGSYAGYIHPKATDTPLAKTPHRISAGVNFASPSVRARFRQSRAANSPHQYVPLPPLSRYSPPPPYPSVSLVHRVQLRSVCKLDASLHGGEARSYFVLTFPFVLTLHLSSGTSVILSFNYCFTQSRLPSSRGCSPHRRQWHCGNTVAFRSCSSLPSLCYAKHPAEQVLRYISIRD